MKPASRMKIERLTLGIDQATAATRVGIDQSYFSRVERGVRQPRPWVQQRIAAVLGVDERELFAEAA